MVYQVDSDTVSVRPSKVNKLPSKHRYIEGFINLFRVSKLQDEKLATCSG